MKALQEKSVKNYFQRFISGTLLSRMSGLLRDLCMAASFGDHPSVASFMIAFRFATLLKRFVGEGPFQSIFIPHFEEMRIQHAEKALHFFRQLYFLTTAFLVFLILFVEGCVMSFLFAISLSTKIREILLLTAWLSPGILFLGL